MRVKIVKGCSLGTNEALIRVCLPRCECSFSDHTAGLTSDIDQMDVELPEDDVQTDRPGQPLQVDQPFLEFRSASAVRTLDVRVRDRERQCRSRANRLRPSVLPVDHVDPELIPRALPTFPSTNKRDSRIFGSGSRVRKQRAGTLCLFGTLSWNDTPRVALCEV